MPVKVCYFFMRGGRRQSEKRAERLSPRKLTLRRVKMKYEEWLNIWLDDYVKSGAKERTYIRYEQLIRRLFRSRQS